MRPTATSNISASNVTASPLPFLPVTFTPVGVFSIFSSFVSTTDLIPRLRKLRSSSFETSSSSSGTSRGNNSTIVVSRQTVNRPKRTRRHAPAPITISDFGTSFNSRM
jgi:hypothetical protein